MEDFDFDKENLTLTWYGPMGMSEMGSLLEATARDSSAVKVPVSIIMLVCFIVSVVGNVCTCAVIVRDRSMRTPTNCYLFNLAVTDLTTAMFIPIEVYLVWVPDAYPFGKIGCIIHILIWDCLSNCSLLTIAAFTVERYLAVSRPFLRHKLVIKSRVYKIVALNWIISGCFGVPDFFLIGVLQKTERTYCYLIMPVDFKILIATEMVVFFIIPMMIIFVLYILIALKMRLVQKLHKNSPVIGNQYRDRTIKMLAAVAATFFFCWFPYFILRLIFVLPRISWIDYHNAWRVFRYLCTVNAYVYTAVNPLLYSLMSRKFSRAFKRLLQGRNSRSLSYNASRELPLDIRLRNTYY